MPTCAGQAIPAALPVVCRCSTAAAELSYWLEGIMGESTGRAVSISATGMVALRLIPGEGALPTTDRLVTSPAPPSTLAVRLRN